MKEKFQFLQQFPIKLLAIVFMTLDHIGAMMTDPTRFAIGSSAYTVGFVFRCIGRLAFPLFVFFLAEGLNKTHDRLNYVLRLALMWGGITLFEIILQAIRPDAVIPAEAFTDLLMYALFIYFIEHKKAPMKLLAIVPLAYIGLSYACDLSEGYAALNQMTSQWSSFFPLFLRSGYSVYGFVMLLGIYYGPKVVNYFFNATVKSSPDVEIDMSEWTSGPRYQGLLNAITNSVIIISTLIFWLIERTSGIYVFEMDIQSWCLLACLLIFCYNGQRGYNKKWFRYFTYLYYPVHLVLIFGVFALFF